MERELLARQNATFKPVSTLNRTRGWPKYAITRMWLIGGLLSIMHYSVAQTDGFTTSFNYSDGTTYGASQCSNDMGDCNYWGNAHNSQVYDENLRIRFEANKPGTTSGITAKLDINGDSVYSMEYKIKFDGGFQWREGGKLPGLAGGQAPSGGAVGRDIARAGNGFSTRFMWRPQGKLVVYTYYRDQAGDYGDDWECDFNFQPDTWYTLKQQVTVNTGSNADGRVEVWVDGVKKLDRQNVRLMTNNNSVDVVFFDSFMGGANDDYDWSPTQTQYLRIDDVKVVKGGNDSTPPPSGTDKITAVSAPETVVAGQTVTVNVDYTAATARKIEVDLQLDSDPYTPYGRGQADVPAGGGTVAVPVSVDAAIPAANDAYQFQVYLTPTDGGWDERLANRTQVDVDATAAETPPPSDPALADTLLSVSVPPAVVPGTNATLTVNYQAATQRDIYATLQRDTRPQTRYGAVTKVDVPPGSGTVEINVPIDPATPIVQDDYQFQVYITGEGQGWFDRLHNVRIPDVDAVSALPPSLSADAITAISVPETVSPGTSVSVALDYQASGERDVWVMLQSDSGEFTPQQIVKTSVGSGSGSLNLTVPLPVSLPLAKDAYQWQVFITTRGGDWTNRLDHRGQKNIDALASNARTGGADQAIGATLSAPALRSYPNPASEQLTVEGSLDYQVGVYDLSGRAVMQRKHLQGQAQLDISGLRPGVYLLKMSDGVQAESQQRLIIE